MTIHRFILVLLIGSLAISPIARSQTTRQTALSGETALGQRFESLASGIALRPPAGTKLFRGVFGTSEVARFVDEDRKWAIKLSRILLEDNKPVPLTTWKDAKNNAEHPGMLQFTIEQFKLERPGAEFFRQDTTWTKVGEVGMLAARY